MKRKKRNGNLCTMSDERKSPRKRSLSLSEQDSERGRKRMKVIFREKTTREQAPKRQRSSENEEEQGLQKRAKMSSLGNKVPLEGERAAQAHFPMNFPVGGNLKIQLTPQRPFGQSLDDYRFHRVLGQGGFGKVMLASLKNKEQLVAVKVINKVMEKNHSILTEKNVLQVAEGSPFLCHGLAAFQTQERSYLVMEYMRGGNLNSRIDRRCGMGLRVSRSLAAEIICGMQYLHSCGIIHRDLKPENILMDDEGHIKIGDFGLAVENVTGEKKIQGRAGTFHYMAPEVISNKAYGASADWWSLGVILCRMMTGRFPFNERLSRMEYTQEVLTGSPSYPDWLPSDAADLLNKLLDKNPETRLGVNGNIKDHPFFAGINWEEVQKSQAIPLRLPSTANDTETGTSGQYYSFMDDDSSISEDHIIHGLSFVVPEWRQE